MCGVAISDAGATHSAQYTSNDAVERTDWTPITGTAALSVGSLYYLSPDVAGRLTTTAPTESGQIVVSVGMAISSQKLSIEIQPFNFALTMTARKPLVLVNGQLQQLQAGDTLNASVNEVDVVALTNASGGSSVIGTPVYISTAGSFALAKADASGTIEVIGLVKDSSIANSASGSIQTDGVLTATTTQWDAVTGQTGGLTAGAVYYLSAATAGKITSTAPGSTGQYVERVGRALSTTDLDISILQPILL